MKDERGLVFQVKVAAGASREKVAGETGGMLKVCVSARREKDKANRALVRLLSKALGSARRDIEIIRGRKATVKSILAKGVTAEKIRALVPAASG